MRLVCGVGDVSIAPTLGNVAQLLQQLGDTEGAIVVLTRALQQYEDIGNQPLATATCHSLAILHQSLGSYREALKYEKAYNKVLSQIYTAEHVKMQESNAMLTQLTSQAVQAAKTKISSKSAQAEHAKPTRPKSNRPMSVLPKPGSTMGTQPLTQVLSWINGGKSKRK